MDRIFTDTENLRAQTRALRSLARHLVRDESAADDLVQEAWMTAIERPPPRGSKLAAWLRGVARNHARDASRADRRRMARERAAAQPEISTSDDPIERLDALENLLGHVRALEDPYRSIVLWRFFDDLSIEVIAARAKTPAATVRTRLRRALELLRLRLDRASGGRRAWVVPLFPLISTPPSAVPLGPDMEKLGSATGLGALGMATKFMTVAGVSIVAAILLATMWMSNSPPLEHEVETEATGNSATASTEFDGEAQTRTPVVATRDGGRRGGGSAGDANAGRRAGLAGAIVFGTVRNEAGEPIAGAKIGGLTKGLRSAVDGTFRAEGVIARRGHERQVHCSADGYARVRHILRMDAQGGEAQLDFTLRRGFVIHGRVTDERGEPVAGAKVTTFYAGDRRATTDPEGRYRCDWLDPGRPEHMLYARAEGFLEAKADVATSSHEVEHDLVLRRGRRVYGRVVDRQGEPVAAAKMFIGFGPFDHGRVEATSAQDGAFAFPVVAPGARKLVTQAPGYAVAVAHIKVPENDDSEVVVELQRARTVKGLVTDAQGAPLADVWLHAELQGMSIEGQAKTDESGVFSFGQAPAESFSLRFIRSGFVAYTEKEVTPGSADLRIVMDRIAQIAGHVVDRHTGRPVPRFVVRFVEPDLRTGESRGSGFSAIWVREGQRFENTDGRFDTGLESLPAGFLTGLEVSAEGYAPTRVGRAIASRSADPDDLRIELEAGIELVGRVVDDATSEPLADALVKLVYPGTPLRGSSDDTHDRAMIRTDAEGRFSFEGVAPGPLHIAVEHEVCGLWLQALDLPLGAERIEQLIRVHGQSTVRGALRDAGDLGVAGARLQLEAKSVAKVRGRKWTTESDDQGRFAFEHVLPGEYQLTQQVRFGGLGYSSWSRTIVVGTEREQTLDVVGPGIGPSLTGSLRGGPVGNVHVVLHPVNSDGHLDPKRAIQRAISSDRTFSFNRVESGTYLLSANVWDGAQQVDHRARTKLEVGSDAVTVSLELRPDR